MNTIHNPDEYMSDLRQILAQGRKRIGMLLGAGAAASILVDKSTNRLSDAGCQLIPVIAGLTKEALKRLKPESQTAITGVIDDLGTGYDIEKILSRVRAFADVLGQNQIRGLEGEGYRRLGDEICAVIGNIINVQLPVGENPYSELAAWIGGTARDHAFEIFTTNYDLLLEEAFERAHIPYFDGFVGSYEPFFDPATVANADLPARWPRLWKLHGSLGWKQNDRGDIVRSQGREATDLIYPTHLKYDQVQKLPYAALIERLRRFLQLPDALLLTTGFSFGDFHITSVIDESLSANPSVAVIALQFNDMASETIVCNLALRRSNMSVYACDSAVINCVRADWKTGALVHPSLEPFRDSYWGSDNGRERHFLLGDFKHLARYVALTHATRAASEAPVQLIGGTET